MGVRIAPLPGQLRSARRAGERKPAATPRPAAIPLETVRAALAHIDADDYARWINVGQALKHNYGGEGEAVWIEWSQTSSKWKDGDEAKWESFDRNRDRPLITVRSIISIARRNGYRPSADEFSSALFRENRVAALLATPPPRQRWAFDGCLPANKVVVLGGAGGTGKSMLLLALAIHYVLGRPFADYFEPPSDGTRKALMLVAEEDVEDIHRRLHHIAGGFGLIDQERAELGELLAIKSVRGEDWRMTAPDANGEMQLTDRPDYLIEQLRIEMDVGLLVLDPSVMFMGGSENDNAHGARYMSALDRMASSAGTAVLVGAHTNKAALNADELDQGALRGGTALVDNARGCWLMRTMTSDEAAARSIAEAERFRFVQFRIAKNNYGPVGHTFWFERCDFGVLQRAARIAEPLTKQEQRRAEPRGYGPIDKVRDLAVALVRQQAQSGKPLSPRKLVEWLQDEKRVPPRCRGRPALEQVVRDMVDDRTFRKEQRRIGRGFDLLPADITAPPAAPSTEAAANLTDILGEAP